MKFAGRKRAPATSPPMGGRGASAQAKAQLDPDYPQEVLGKLEGNHSLAELIQTLTQDLCLKNDELAKLAGVSTDVIVQWAAGRDDGRCVERLDDLGAIAVSLIRDGKMPPRAVAAWLRSRNRALSWSRPLEALRRRGYLPVHSAAEAACAVSLARKQPEIR